MIKSGQLQFSETNVDQATGSVIERAVFPNPKHLLLPGMFVRATIEEGVNEKGVLVPQQAVTHDVKGNATAYVITADNKVELANAQDHARHWRQVAGGRWCGRG